eukprot:7327346-Pyramimonas_sp.AAC.1
MGPSNLLASLEMLSSHSVPHGARSGTAPLGPLRISREVYNPECFDDIVEEMRHLCEHGPRLPPLWIAQIREAAMQFPTRTA